ncbi:MAG: BCCT family transporter [Maricaulaceae bacterium]
MTKRPYKTDYETGQDNVEFYGFDMHNPVFFVSAALILAFVIGAIAAPVTAQTALTGARDWVINSFDWLFTGAINVIFLASLGVAVSPLGRIRLGGDKARPEFGRLSWIAMLFSAGVGIGLVFFGAAEPLGYFTGDAGGTPLNATPLTPEAERLAFSATLFHWGLAPWGVYALVGLALAFFTFNKGLPLTMRSMFFPLLGDRVWGWPGHLIDMMAVLATLFGLATSLGLGARQAASGMNFLFGVDASLVTQVSIIAGVTAVATVSVVRGMDKGVKVLSNLNMALAVTVFAFVLLAGPTLVILESIGLNAIHYLEDGLALGNPFNRQDDAFYHGWTIFYWAWWISWSPFVGMFIARISKGRTLREFIGTVLVLPWLVALLWFSVFGATAIQQVKAGVGALPEGVSDVSLVLFQMLDVLPLAEIVSFVAIVLLLVFFVTSSDSGSLVIDSITDGGKLHAPVAQRVFWATMEGSVAAALLIGGGTTALAALQAGAVATALPFTVILLIAVFSLYKALLQEHAFMARNRAVDPPKPVPVKS